MIASNNWIQKFEIGYKSIQESISHIIKINNEGGPGSRKRAASMLQDLSQTVLDLQSAKIEAEMRGINVNDLK